MKVANILLNGVRYESDLSENVETGESQMSMKLLCIAIYRMPPSLRSLCTNHFLGENNHYLNVVVHKALQNLKMHVLYLIVAEKILIGSI